MTIHIPRGGGLGKTISRDSCRQSPWTQVYPSEAGQEETCKRTTWPWELNQASSRRPGPGMCCDHDDPRICLLYSRGPRIWSLGNGTCHFLPGATPAGYSYTPCLHGGPFPKPQVSAQGQGHRLKSTTLSQDRSFLVCIIIHVTSFK